MILDKVNSKLEFPRRLDMKAFCKESQDIIETEEMEVFTCILLLIISMGVHNDPETTSASAAAIE